MAVSRLSCFIIDSATLFTPFPMFFWNRPPATPTPDDPYTVLPGPKSRRRSEIPATSVPTHNVGQLLRDESSVCSQHSRSIPGPDVRRDPMRIFGEQHEDSPRLRPVIGRQRSRSVGESRYPPSREHHQQRWNGAGLVTVYPGTTRSVRAGEGSAYVGGGDDEEEQSVRLQGMPARIGSGLGRKRSRSAGASIHLRSDQHQHQPAYRHHQGVASFESIYSGVYVEYGVGAAEERPARIGLGRQRSRSAGEIMRLRHGYPGESGGVAGGRELRGYHQEQQEARLADTIMGRQRSRSVGEKIRPHMQSHVRPPQSAVPQTRPLALVDKYVVDGRGSPSSSRYPLPGPTAPPPSSADPQYQSLSQHQAHPEHVQPRPQYRDPPPSQSQHLPIPRSILRMPADPSSRDRPKPPSGPKPIPPSQRSKYSPSLSPPAPHIASPPPTSLPQRGPPPNPPSLHHSQIPVPVSQSQCRGHVDEHRAAESGYEHPGGCEPGVRGHDEIEIVSPVVGMGRDDVGLRGRMHHDQPLHGCAPFDGNEMQDRPSAPAREPGRSSNNIRNSTRLPNPHPHPDQEAEDDSVVLMPSDRLFEMERLSLLGAPSSSSARSSPIGSIVSQHVVVAEWVPRRSSPAGHGGSVVLVKDRASGIDVVSVCSDSAPALEERLMDVSFPSTIKSSILFAPPARPTPPTPIPIPTRATTPSESSTNPSSATFSASRSSSTSTSAPHDTKQRQHIRALERELERNEVVVAEAIGETFRAREREAVWKRRVGELEAMLGVGGRARSAGASGGEGEGEGEGEVVNLREKLRVVVEERDEALMLVAEVRRVVQVVGGAAISR